MTFTAIDVEHNNSVATIKIKPFERTQREGANHKDYVDAHVRTSEGWRIAKREHLCDWMRDDTFVWAAPRVVASGLVEPPS